MKVYIGPYVSEVGEKIEDVEIDHYDMYNLDYTLALIIHPALIRFKENLHGYPGGLTYDEWVEILDKMIYSFKMTLDHDENFTEYHDNYDRIKEGFELFGKYYPNLWD